MLLIKKGGNKNVNKSNFFNKIVRYGRCGGLIMASVHVFSGLSSPGSSFC